MPIPGIPGMPIGGMPIPGMPIGGMPIPGWPIGGIVCGIICPVCGNGPAPPGPAPPVG